MFGTILRRQHIGSIVLSGVASGGTERANWSIVLVCNGSECCKVHGDDMLDGHTQVQDVRGGSGMTVHGQGGKVPRATEKMDPLPWNVG